MHSGAEDVQGGVRSCHYIFSSLRVTEQGSQCTPADKVHSDTLQHGSVSSLGGLSLQREPKKQCNQFLKCDFVPLIAGNPGKSVQGGPGLSPKSPPLQ